MGKPEKPEANQLISWTALIDAVRTPLNFFTLALLVGQGILIYLAPKVQGADLRILLLAALGLTFLLVILVGFIQYKNLTQKEFHLKPDSEIIDYKYDIFLSVPMAAASAKDYPETRELALGAIEVLQKACNMNRVYYAGVNTPTKKDFNPRDAAALDDLDAITTSQYFVMLYPKRTASSVLFEAGCALALGKKCLYLVRDRSHLPFLMQQAEQAFDFVKLYEYESLTDIQKILSNRKCFEF